MTEKFHSENAVISSIISRRTFFNYSENHLTKAIDSIKNGSVVAASSKQLVEAEGLPNSFKNNVLGRKWFEGFLTRHQRVGRKRAEHLCKARTIVTENRIPSWFAPITEELADNVGILKAPQPVFNMHETPVHLSPKGGLVLVKKGKFVYDVAANDKENVTNYL